MQLALGQIRSAIAEEALSLDGMGLFAADLDHGQHHEVCNFKCPMCMQWRRSSTVTVRSRCEWKQSGQPARVSGTLPDRIPRRRTLHQARLLDILEYCHERDIDFTIPRQWIAAAARGYHREAGEVGSGSPQHLGGWGRTRRVMTARARARAFQKIERAIHAMRAGAGSNAGSGFRSG